MGCSLSVQQNPGFIWLTSCGATCTGDERMKLKTVRASAGAWHPQDLPISTRKALQSAKIRELRQALVARGFSTLSQQAMALGLSRSTAWSVLKGNHKGSGLSAATIKRMLASPQIPAAAKKILLEYIEQKCAGAYGHSQERVREFKLKSRTWLELR